MAIKLDMSKGYDRVEWSFLEEFMRKMGFNERWIHLTMLCVKTVTYSILINGEPRGLIHPTRGIRQWDQTMGSTFPLSLPAMHRRNGDIHGCFLCKKGLKLTHLLFADDSLLFCRATVEECDKHILRSYERVSGQKVNRSKTTLFFSKNTHTDIKTSIKHALGSKRLCIMKNTQGCHHLWEKEKRPASTTLRRECGKNSKVGKGSYYHKQGGRC